MFYVLFLQKLPSLNGVQGYFPQLKQQKSKMVIYFAAYCHSVSVARELYHVNKFLM